MEHTQEMDVLFIQHEDPVAFNIAVKNLTLTDLWVYLYPSQWVWWGVAPAFVSSTGFQWNRIWQVFL